jgi:hypothetical protein
MLYRPEAFEPLTDEPWDEERVRRGIREIVASADEAYDPETLWPAGEWESWQTPTPLKTLYVGAAGVIWALETLRRRGHAETKLDLGDGARRTLDAYRREPDLMAGVELPDTAHSGLLGGETGILVVACRLAPSAELADALEARIRENVDTRADELMWGVPGTLRAAAAMYEATGEERWATAWHDSAYALLARRDADGLWTQHLWGTTFRALGASHGTAGNVAALLAGGLLDGARREQLERETNDVLARTAVVEDGFANWPNAEGESLVNEEDGEIKVQWCAGGPGVVTCAAPYLDAELFLAGCELPWRTGPPILEKGPSICHGTAGNGYAFLKAFARTGDEEWLGRARHFAIHALEQVERRGPRYSLFTGGVGVALYAADCLDVRSDYPVVETWD